MVSSKLIGRLGNSLMQIAMSVGYARKYGYKWAAQERPHNNESAIHRVFPNLPKTNETGKIFQEHPAKVCQQHRTHYDLCHFDYHDIPDMGPNVYFVGFWQSWKYFEHCKEEVKEVFKLPHVDWYEDYVSIHVRRGDYVQHSGSFPPIDGNYLDKAFNVIIEKTGVTNPKFMVFSDDINWCKENIGWYGAKVEFSEGRNELQDLSLMASCGHHIIANSTFSWWGAYLGHNENRIVISPSHKIGNWFGHSSGIKKDCVDLLPESWVQIEFR